MPKPNVLIIVSDDQGYADTSWTGGKIPTVELEKLKNESVLLSEFYVHPVCTPTRAALFTGRYAANSGMTGPLLLAAPCHLNDQQPTFGREMKKRGYYTVLSGKWHLGHHAWKHTPVGHGFDEFHGVLNCCAAYYSKSYFHPLFGHKIDWRHNKKAIAPAPSKHSSELFADKLVEVIERGLDQPLFMMMTLTAPHSPLQSEERHKELCLHLHTERRRQFCGLMMSVDEAVGRVREALHKMKQWDNTLVVYMNDNGGNVWEGGRNYPFRAGKQSSFEGGSRATGLIKFPAAVANVPKEYSGLIHVSDVMPTVLGFVDRQDQVDLPVFQRGDALLGTGYDFSLPLLGMAQENVREDCLMSYEPTTNKLGYRMGNWKLVSGNIGDPRRFGEPMSDNEWIGSTVNDIIAESLMTFQHGIDEDASGTLDESVREVFVLAGMYWDKIWKFIINGGKMMPEPVLLFDLSVDPYEDNNIAAAHPEIVREMQNRVDMMKENFNENCDWFLMDKKVKFETVTFIDPKTGGEVNKQYHSPWVNDDDMDIYEPDLWNLNPTRMYTAVAIVAVEVICLVWLLRCFIQTVFRRHEKQKKE